jgi:uncharacterized UBP type Zn finger protein
VKGYMRFNLRLVFARKLYKLRAVQVHHGDTPFPGHFTCYIAWHDEWWHANDGDVMWVEEREVLEAEAYLLLYERL